MAGSRSNKNTIEKNRLRKQVKQLQDRYQAVVMGTGKVLGELEQSNKIIDSLAGQLEMVIKGMSEEATIKKSLKDFEKYKEKFG